MIGAWWRCWGEYANLGLAMTGFGDLLSKQCLLLQVPQLYLVQLARKIKFFYDFRSSICRCCCNSRFLALGWWRFAGMDFKDFAGSTVVHVFEVSEPLPVLRFLDQEKASILKVALNQYPHTVFHWQQ